MLARVDLRSGPGVAPDLGLVLARPGDGADGAGEPGTAGPLATVRAIIADVRERGDDALRDYTARFDGCTIDTIAVPAESVDAAGSLVPQGFLDAVAFAAGNIRAYHETQLESPAAHGHDAEPYRRNGVTVRELIHPLDRVGLYVPGGRAVYPSTVLMTAIPARVAGVEQIALCVPPDRAGLVPAAVLVAARAAGVSEIYRVGGAQAVAAMAYGTPSIAAVDAIFGPGNVYVALAKREVAGRVKIESNAGPSELVVIADGSVPADWVAVDLMAQAEHGPDGAAVLVTWSETVADAVDAALERRTAASGRRSDIEATMRSFGRVVLVDGPDEAVAVANHVAPEHLQLMCADAERLVPLVRHAGAVFVGPYSPVPVGDYVAGVNHVLPTNRSARFASALRVSDFQKHVHVVSLDEAGLAGLARHVEAFAAVEGLETHGLTVSVRTRTVPGTESTTNGESAAPAVPAPVERSA